jgi:hypothetical protein
MSDADFQVRIGASSSEAVDLLTQLVELIDKIEAYEKDNSAPNAGDSLLSLRKRRQH